MTVLSVQGLSIQYLSRRGPVHAVRNVSFELAKGETLAIIGESGSGKTTLAISLIRLSPRSARPIECVLSCAVPARSDCSCSGPSCGQAWRVVRLNEAS